MLQDLANIGFRKRFFNLSLGEVSFDIVTLRLAALAQRNAIASGALASMGDDAHQRQERRETLSKRLREFYLALHQEPSAELQQFLNRLSDGEL